MLQASLYNTRKRENEVKKYAIAEWL